MSRAPRTEAEAKATLAHIQMALMVETVCGELPADYRRDFFRAAMRDTDDATAERLLEAVIGRLDDADPLSTLLGWADYPATGQ